MQIDYSRYLTPTKNTSERSELIKWFVENLRNKEGKPFNARMIAIKLSHLKLPDLYYFKSVCLDLQKTKGQDSFQKFFWWSIKSDTIIK